MPHVGELEGPAEATLQVVREHTEAMRTAARLAMSSAPRIAAAAPSQASRYPATRSTGARRGVSASTQEAHP